jgi:capsular polysaccharide transport system ATP-binding protein
MSLEFRNVSKLARSGRAAGAVLSDLNFRIERGQRVGILGLPKSGKTTLLRMMCGTERSDAGSIERLSSVSWPIPCSDYFARTSTVAMNIKFVARLFGLNADSLVFEVGELLEITPYLNERLGRCPRFVAGRLGFGIGIAVGFDICLFDERLTPAGKDFKETATKIVQSLDSRRAVVLATSSAKELNFDCDFVLVLDNGKIKRFEDVKQATEYFKRLLRNRAKPKDEVVDSEPEQVEEEEDLEVGI